MVQQTKTTVVSEPDAGVQGENTTTQTEQKKRKKGKKSATAVLQEIAEQVKNTVIILPSTLDDSLIKTTALQEAILAEIALRKGEANDALDDVRAMLIARSSLQSKEKDLRGVEAHMRMQTKIGKKNDQIDLAKERYNRAREALIKLGGVEMDVYRKLERSDLQAFTIYMGDAKLGDSRKRPSWIWGDISFVDEEVELKDYMKDSQWPSKYDSRVNLTGFKAIRTHWFRTKALKTRWQEEVLLLPEEMRRTVRYHNHYRLQWLSISERSEDAGRAGSISERSEHAGKAAYARK